MKLIEVHPLGQNIQVTNAGCSWISGWTSLGDYKGKGGLRDGGPIGGVATVEVALVTSCRPCLSLLDIDQIIVDTPSFRVTHMCIFR